MNWRLHMNADRTKWEIETDDRSSSVMVDGVTIEGCLCEAIIAGQAGYLYVHDAVCETGVRHITLKPLGAQNGAA